MSNTPDLHRAIEQLDATLHPQTASQENVIELTEEMIITSPIIDEEQRQQLITTVEQSIREQLPQLIADAVDQALATQADRDTS